jgi:hypothetical protein
MTAIKKIIGLESIPAATSIARYFSREKFDLLVKGKMLWFANVKTFQDTHERQIPEAFYASWDEDRREAYKTTIAAKDSQISGYVSCWTVFDSENYALWKIYDPNSNGLCIVTTIRKLKEQIKPEDAILCKVEYIDPTDKGKRIDMPLVIYEPTNIPHAMRVKEKYKILPYKYESEIRAIIYRMSKEKGLAVPVNLKEMVNEIRFSPFMKEEDAFAYKSELIATFDSAIFRQSIICEK